MELKTKYLPLSTKQQIISQIVENSIYEQDGMKFISYVNKRVSYDLSLISFFSDLDINTVDLDQLYSDGEMDLLYSLIPQSELDFINKAVDYELEQQCSVYNSLAGVLNRNLEKLVSRLPDEKGLKSIIRSFSKELGKISPENMEILKGLTGTQIK